MTKEERATRVASMKARIAAFTDAQFGEEITEVFDDPGRRHYGRPSVSPSAVPHPRVMLTREMLPSLRAALDNPDCAEAVKGYRALLKNETDGVLPPPYEHGENGPVHNNDAEILSVIEARTVEYLLTGDRYWGYAAILAMMNYLSAFEIGWINCDAFRVYGMVMYTAALVYDRCYDLLTPADRRRIISGVEHRLCRGYSSIPEKARAGGIKLEMGFPPMHQGPISGHGNEATLLRDYLAFSIAIADEVPGWWDYVGGRLENEYIPAREIFYAAGRYPQGRGYAVFRYICDLWSATLLEPIYGKNPYPVSDMKRIVHSLLAQETDRGFAFTTGDGHNPGFSGTGIAHCLVFSAYLFRDPVARAAAKRFRYGVDVFTNGAVNITPTLGLFLAMRSTEAVECDRDHLPLIHRNRGYFNQYISRSGREDGSAVVMMKAGGRYTSNHEHSNAGNFQIWYKGYLTGDTGMYQSYGSENHYGFHVQSIAHNVPLVFNPARHDPEPIPDAEGKITMQAKLRSWYNGGQRRPGESKSIEMWHDRTYISAETPVMQSEMRDGKPIYAYISTDITRAYEPDTVAYLRRSMITSYETDGSTPMTLFVFDRIESVDPSFKKTFLLQINGEEAPTLDGNRVTTVSGEGKLSLTSVTESTMEAIGGVGRNYLVHGKQLKPTGEPAKTWGRVEISPIGERVTDHMLNVLTVVDRELDPPRVERLVCGRACEGAYVAGNAAIFRRSREDLGSDIAFTLPAPAYTYFSGLNEGEFEVTDATGATVATLSVGENKNLAAAHLPEGRLLLHKL